MAATKLTLRLDEDLIATAKDYAASAGKSVSQLVADYFHALERQPRASKAAEPLPPLVRSLQGAWKGHKVGEADYRKHLAEKHR